MNKEELTIKEMQDIRLEDLIAYADREFDSECEYACARRLMLLRDMLITCVTQIADQSGNSWIINPTGQTRDFHVNDLERYLGIPVSRRD